MRVRVSVPTPLQSAFCTASNQSVGSGTAGVLTPPAGICPPGADDDDELASPVALSVPLMSAWQPPNRDAATTASERRGAPRNSWQERAIALFVFGAGKAPWNFFVHSSGLRARR